MTGFRKPAFPNPHLPIVLPLYLRHFVDRTTVVPPLPFNDVSRRKNEDEVIDGVDDDDSVEDAFEASGLTEAVLQRESDLVGNEDDDVQFTDAKRHPWS